jgi:hypothetical protein
MPSEKGAENSIPLLEAERQDGTLDKIDDDVEAQPIVAAPTGAGRKFLIWTAINMAATIGIVFTNKAIFNDPSFKLMQTSFASFHFVCTGLTLWIVSRPSIGAFIPKRAGLVEMLPVSSRRYEILVHSSNSSLGANFFL